MLSLTVAGAHCIYLSLVLPGSLAPCRSLARSLSSSLWCSLALSIPVALSLSRSLALVRSRSSSVALSLSLLHLFPPLSLYLSSSLSLSLSLSLSPSLPPFLPLSLSPSPINLPISLCVFILASGLCVAPCIRSPQRLEPDRGLVLLGVLAPHPQPTPLWAQCATARGWRLLGAPRS